MKGFMFSTHNYESQSGRSCLLYINKIYTRREQKN